MQPLLLDLNQSNRQEKRWSRILQGASALALLVIAALRHQADWLWFLVGLYALAVVIVVFVWPTVVKPYRLVADEQGIRGRVSWVERIDCSWAELKRARLELLHLELETVGGKVYRIHLGNLTYQEHQELKPRLRVILEEHNLLQEASSPCQRT